MIQHTRPHVQRGKQFLGPIGPLPTFYRPPSNAHGRTRSTGWTPQRTERLNALIAERREACELRDFSTISQLDALITTLSMEARSAA